MSRYFCILILLHLLIFPAEATDHFRDVFGQFTIGLNDDEGRTTYGLQVGSLRAISNVPLVLGVFAASSEHDEVEVLTWDPVAESGVMRERETGDRYGIMLKSGYTMDRISFLGGIGYSTWREVVSTIDVTGPFVVLREDGENIYRLAWSVGAIWRIWHVVVTGSYNSRRGPVIGLGGTW